MQCMYVRTRGIEVDNYPFEEIVYCKQVYSIQFIRSPEENVPTRGFQTQSGLKYFDIKTSDVGRTPLYGAYIQIYIHTFIVHT